VIVEAFANGVPVVASDIPPHRALIEESNGGKLFPIGDAAAAGVAIGALVDDAALRRSMGSAARAYSERFDADRIAGLIIGQWTAAVRAGGAREQPARPPSGS
jgi:phosphatidylinositol alpha-mannosyltransferase